MLYLCFLILIDLLQLILFLFVLLLALLLLRYTTFHHISILLSYLLFRLDEVFIGGSYGKTKSYSEQVAGTIDEEVKAVIDSAYDRCIQLLTENRDKLDAVAEFLLKNENMTGDEFRALMDGTPVEEIVEE